ncbi:MAG: hypothetical protein AAF849_24775 [Bacteroidota bacterium]
MKNLLFLLSFFFYILGFSTLSANTSVNVKAEPIVKIKSVEQEKSIHLYFANLLQQTTHWELMDKNGKRVYQETISDKDAYAKKLNLSKIKSGNYVIVVENERIEVKQPILIARDDVRVLDNKRSEKMAPSIEFKDKAIHFQLAPGSRAKLITVNIFDGEEMIYEAKEVMMSTMRKQYSINNLHRGNYIFRVIVDDKAYYEEIEVE